MVCNASFVFAQNWKLKSDADFHYYYTDSLQVFLPKYDSIFKNELFLLQKQLNYHVDQPIDIFITDQYSAVYSLKNRPQITEESSGGIILLEQKKVILHIAMSSEEIKKQFRAVAASVLIDEMMNGGSLQDKLRNANLIHLPDWVVPGLTFYLSDQWSASTDNTWRVLHDENGLKDFNAIPDKYLEIKGAAMWKYITYKYGENAISTILYMSRLTRKFNAALFYAYQISMYDVYTGALAFYKIGYENDQQKPNPIHGRKLKSDGLIDLCVVDQNQFYTLQNTTVGINLVYHNTASAKTETIYKLSFTEYPNPMFSGNIQCQGKTISLMLNTSRGLKIVTIENNKIVNKDVPLRWYSKCIKKDNDYYLLQANINGSTIYKWNKEGLQLVFKIENYIESFDILNNKLVFILQTASKSIIQEVDLTNNVVLAENEMSFGIRQVVWANDSVVLFNSEQSGIWNGQVWNIQSNKVNKVTNYRSNIAYHFYSNQVFAEYLERGQYSSLFLADYIPTEEFYTYDIIEPAYFKSVKSVQTSLQAFKKKIEIDSLEIYTFQSPINPAFDFKLANFDSLANSEINKAKLIGTDVLAPDLFKPANLVVKLNNGLMFNSQAAYLEEIPRLTPNNINVRIASIFKNQFQNKQLQVAYAGLIQQGTQDIGLQYSTISNWRKEITALHRQRVQFLIEERRRFTTDLVSFGVSRRISKPINVFGNINLRSDRSNLLAIDKESLSFPAQHKAFASLVLGSKVQLESRNYAFSSLAKISTQLQLTQPGFNTTVDVSANFATKLNYWATINLKTRGATSFGNNPNIFSLGGAQWDVFSRYYNRSVGTNVSPSIIHLIYGVRGFPVNYRNGSTFGLANLEVELKPLHLLFSRPLTSEVFSNFKVIPFADLASSFYGKNMYDAKNNLNTRTITSSTGTIIAEVNAFKNPLIYAAGCGIATKIYSYNVRLDYALGYEDGRILNRNFHLSFGYVL